MNGCSASLNNYAATPPVIRGTCHNGQCVCSVGFGGQDCSKISGTPKPIEFKSPRKTRKDACTQDICTSTCSFGGSCIDTTTCECFDHWGHGAAADLSTVTDTVDDSTDAVKKKRSKKSLLIERWSMSNADRSHLRAVLGELGYSAPIPSGALDPCVTPWMSESKPPEQSSHLLIVCNNRGRVTEIDVGRMKLKGSL
jgi:hypothetical protein